MIILTYTSLCKRVVGGGIGNAFGSDVKHMNVRYVPKAEVNYG